jgi:transcriptional regulator with XRE-family HTH domain
MTMALSPISAKRDGEGGKLITNSERSAVRSQLPRKKAPNPIDQHVGSRVRMRRMMLAMSQEKLGDALGLTFQQVQKYEKGTNRIGASRLQQISHILQVPVAFFFEGLPNASAPHSSNESALSTAQIDDFVSDSDGLRLIRALMRIDNATLRRRIRMLVQEIADEIEATVAEMKMLDKTEQSDRAPIPNEKPEICYCSALPKGSALCLPCYTRWLAGRRAPPSGP